MELKENKIKKWYGNYRGVTVEINNWKSELDNHWTYYLIIDLDFIPKENNPESYWLNGKKERDIVLYNFYKHPILPNLEWHGRITWYSKEHGFDGSKKIIKIGCDYSHAWDDSTFYNLDIVKDEAERTAKKFLEYVPSYKYHSNKNIRNYLKILDI
jgi:hypothetical protein